MNRQADFDVELPGTWPDDFWDLFNKVHSGLSDGDLRPLGTLLIAGHQLPSVIRERLAKMIGGHGDERYRLEAIGRPGQRPLSVENHDQKRHFEIGLYADKRLREVSGRGAFKLIVGETMDRYRVGRSTVTNALKYVRENIAEGERTWPAGMPRPYYELLCETFLSKD